VSNKTFEDTSYKPGLQIGIGGTLTGSFLPHHRAYGSVPRRFGWLNFGFRFIIKQWDAKLYQDHSGQGEA